MSEYGITGVMLTDHKAKEQYFGKTVKDLNPGVISKVG